MKYFNIILLAGICLITACQSNESNSNAQTEAIAKTQAAIPGLLDRPSALQQGKEWESVQNLFVKNRDKILVDEKSDEARLALAQIYIHEARVTGEHGHYYPAALKILDGIDPAHSDDDIRFRMLAMKSGVQLSLHDFHAALKTAKEAVIINPYNAQIYGALVDAQVELGNYEEAVKMADKMVSIRPDLRSYARVSYLREIYGDVDGAIEAMEMAVKAAYPGYEESAWARLTLGEMYEKYLTLEDAEKQYRQILIERPDYPFAIAALGNIELQRANYDEAEKLLKKAAEIIPEFSFYESLAELYRITGREEEFNNTMEALWVMLQDDTESGHNMALEFANLKHNLAKAHGEALEYALAAYQKRPENIDVNHTLATIYFGLGDIEKADMHLQKASRTNAQFPALKELQQELAMM
ncbi:MAG: tetratricopeptide repeat protein [Chitinophagales bacterium]|nr:tetratricopeptide repeat protein [Chitinophagales bacterium]